MAQRPRRWFPIAEALFIEEDLGVTEGWQRESVANNLRVIADEAGASSESLALGTIPVRVRVKVTFRLVNRSP